MLGFPGRELSQELTELLAGGLAGVAIYPRNFRDIAELSRLTHAIRQAAARPVLIGIDQEGGTKFSLGEPFTPWPSPAELGRLADCSARREDGSRHGSRAARGRSESELRTHARSGHESE